MDERLSTFDGDADFEHEKTHDLVTWVEDGERSVVVRGRSMLELGRRAGQDRQIRPKLVEWARSANYMDRRWYGRISLAWVAASCLGYSSQDPADRLELISILDSWLPVEKEDLLFWARRELWFDGVS